MAISEEENCVRVIASALVQVSDRLNGTSSVQTDSVSVSEAAEFTSMLSSIVASAEQDLARTRMLLFEINPELLEILASFLQTPQFPGDGDPLTNLIVAVLRCICRIVCTCCNDHVSERSSESAYLSSICSEKLDRCGCASNVAALLSPMVSVDVQFASAETLFALAMRSELARTKIVSTSGLRSLLAVLGDEGSSPLRAYVAATLRELANSHPTSLLEDSALNVITRLIALDASTDVRALCCETLSVVFNSETAGWAVCPYKKQLASALVGRMEQESSHEVLETALKLSETLIMCDAGFPESAESTFTEYFLALYADRCLISALSVGGRVSALAARTLRVLLQHAPYYRYAAFNIAQHFPSLSQLLKCIVELGSIKSDAGDVVMQILKVEVTIAFCMILVQDPRCRQLISSQLLEYPQWLQKLRASALQNLNSAAIEYYGGMWIIDCLGDAMSDPEKVVWEAAMRPSRSSIQDRFDQQEKTWVALAEEELRRAPHQNVTGGTEEDTRVARLNFILLSFAAHLTLTPPPKAKHSQRAPERSQDSAMRDSDAQPTEWHTRGPRAPNPTRASILREWKTHPEKLAALQHAVTHPQMMADPASSTFGGASTRQYYMDPTQLSPRRSNVPPRTAVFSKFDAALSLCSAFAQYHNKVGEPVKVVYEVTPDGAFARRQPAQSAWYSAPNPMHTKSWGIQQLKEGDLFYFSIPFTALNSLAVEQVRSRAMRHLSFIRRSFIITPQAAKARRWFLFDMLNHIMPGIIRTLTELLELFALHGDENVKFPIVMFREKEISQQGEVAALHSGNLLEVLDQVRFYFQNISDKQQRMASPEVSSTYLKDLELKIQSLAAAEFTGEETGVELGYESAGSKDSDEVSVTEPIGSTRGLGLAGRNIQQATADDVSDVSSVE